MPLAEYQLAYDALGGSEAEALARFEKLASDYPEDPMVRLHCQRLRAGESGDLIVMAEK